LIIILMTALVITLVIYFSELGGGRVVASAGAAASGAISSAAGAAGEAAANMKMAVPSNLGEGVSTAGAMAAVNNAGGGLYVIHGVLAVIFFILYISLHDGNGLKELQDTVKAAKDAASDSVSQATANVDDVSHAMV